MARPRRPSSDLPFVVSPFPDPVPNGYNAFTEVRQAPPTNGPWSIDFGSGDRFARLLAAAARLRNQSSARAASMPIWVREIGRPCQLRPL